MAAVETALNEAISRQGRVVGIKGPPGIGKSRITREASAAAERHGIEVISTSCESHSSQLAFHAAAGLLRGFFGVSRLDRALGSRSIAVGPPRFWSKRCLHRAREGDLDDAQAAVDQLAAMPAEQGFLYHELPLLRLNALLARARGDDAAYRDLRDRYLAWAEKFGMEGHIAIARAMT